MKAKAMEINGRIFQKKNHKKNRNFTHILFFF